VSIFQIANQTINMSNLIATKKNQELLKIALKNNDTQSSNTKALGDSGRAQNDKVICVCPKCTKLHSRSGEKD